MAKSSSNLGFTTAGAVGGFSSCVLAYLNSGLSDLSKEVIDFLTIVTPIVSAGLVSLVLWFFVLFGGKTINQLASSKAIDSHINFLTKRIKKHKKDGFDTAELENELNEGVLTKSKLMQDQLEAVKKSS